MSSELCNVASFKERCPEHHALKYKSWLAYHITKKYKDGDLEYIDGSLMSEGVLSAVEYHQRRNFISKYNIRVSEDPEEGHNVFMRNLQRKVEQEHLLYITGEPFSCRGYLLYDDEPVMEKHYEEKEKERIAREEVRWMIEDPHNTLSLEDTQNEDYSDSGMENDRCDSEEDMTSWGDADDDTTSNWDQSEPSDWGNYSNTTNNGDQSEQFSDWGNNTNNNADDTNNGDHQSEFSDSLEPQNNYETTKSYSCIINIL